MITVLAEQLGQGDDIGKVFSQFATIPEHTVAVGVEPRHQGGARSPADWILAVHIFETHAGFRQLIQHGCLALGVTKSAQSGVQIVGHQEQDIGLALCASCWKGKAHNAADQWE